MNILKKSLSVVLSVLMFVSVCSCLMSTTVSAAADLGAVTTYEFDKNVFATKYNLYTSNNVWGYVTKDFAPAGGKFDLNTLTATVNNAVNKIPFTVDDGKTGNWDGMLTFEEGKTYRFEVDFSYDATAGASMLCVGLTRTRIDGYDEKWSDYAGANLGASSYEVVTINDTNKTGRARGEILYTANANDAGRTILVRFTAVGDATITLNSAKITVLNADATNVAFGNNTARSIRAEGKDADDNYQSAGLRFRVNVNRDLLEGKDEIGFVVIPTSKIAAGEKWYEFNAQGGLDNDAAKMVGGCKNKIYAQYNDGPVRTVDFQLILTGLTRENVTDKDLKGAEFTAVLFTQVGSEYQYYFVGTTSYTEVKEVYAGRNVTTDSLGNNY